jgi:hypothetical protein
MPHLPELSEEAASTTYLGVLEQVEVPAREDDTVFVKCQQEKMIQYSFVRHESEGFGQAREGELTYRP